VIAETPEPLHYAVIFTSTTSDNTEGYVDMAAKMVELARLQPGSPGIESARSEVAITVSYWSDRESIKAWKLHAEHPAAQKNGRIKKWSRGVVLGIPHAHCTGGASLQLWVIN
jgi:heme-degrading monooxygenase HmoA